MKNLARLLAGSDHVGHVILAIWKFGGSFFGKLFNILSHLSDYSAMTDLKKVRITYALCLISYLSIMYFAQVFLASESAPLILGSLLLFNFVMVFLFHIYLGKFAKKNGERRLRYILHSISFYLFPFYAFYHLFYVLKDSRKGLFIRKNTKAFYRVVGLQLAAPIFYVLITQNYCLSFTSPSMIFISKISMEALELFNLKKSYKDCKEIQCIDQLEVSLDSFYKKKGINSTSLILGNAVYAAVLFKVKENRKDISKVDITLRLLNGTLKIAERSYGVSGFQDLNKKVNTFNILPLISPFYSIEVNLLSTIETIVLGMFYPVLADKHTKLIDLIRTQDLDTKQSEEVLKLRARIDKILKTPTAQFASNLKKLQKHNL